jgi:hypothetical protein
MRLLDHCPDWFTVEAETARHFDGRACPAETIWAVDGIALRTTLGLRPSVGEVIPGTVLPKQCAERHLYGDATFCMGLNPKPLLEAADAVRWWDHLDQYLRCQSTASETGLWPPHHGLDHGRDGGAFHLQALDLASELGIDAEYFEVVSGLRPDFSSATKRRFHGRFAFRRLVEIEGQRRRAKLRFDMAAATSGEVCCGTMRECALPKWDASRSPRGQGLPQRALLLASAAQGPLVDREVSAHG